MAGPAPILNGNDFGVFFNESLLRNIKQENNTEVLSAIQTADPCNLTSSLGTTLLHFAAKYGNEWLTKHLLNLGMNVDVKNRVQETPLMYAVSASRKETVRLLLEANADIFVPDASGECALAKALNGTVSENVLKLILDKVTVESLSNSVHVNNKSFHENCPLYHFIPFKNVALTRFLLEKGMSPIDVVKPNTDGETSLHLAVKQVDYQHVKLLLEFNANVNAAKRNEDHETPLAFCCQDGDNSSETLEIVKTLLAAGAIMINRPKRKIMVRSILTEGGSETIRVLLQNQLDLTFKGEGVTPLNFLARNSTPNILREVLEGLDFDVNNRCSPGSCTMLHCAVLVKNVSSIKFLLERGADMTAEYSERGTPLGGLVESLIFFKTTLNRIQLDNILECVDVLLEAGADCQIFRKRLFNRPLIYYEPFSDELIEILSPVIAHLAMFVASGIAIDRFNREEIQSCQQLESIFDATKLQFDEFKRIKIDRYVTLYDFLTMKDKMISLIARNSRLTSNLIGAVEKCNLKLHYNRKLRQRFLKFTQLVEMRKKVAIIINKMFMKFCDGSVGNIAILIVNYLSDKDLHKVLSIYM